MGFKSCVFIGISVDGFIARLDGDLQWLISRGEATGEYGYDEFISGIGTIVMGRGTYEAGLGFGEENWPYHGLDVVVLSTSLETDDPRITIYRSLDEVVEGLNARGVGSAYIDGGKVIQSFLRAGLIDELTISTVPVLIGTGVPLFGPLEADVSLRHLSTKVLEAGMVQTKYAVERG
ncbi:dihydrofolate reductase family protein [Nonomuraea sp. NPDC050790]|uniref:dihydrofolate reductase family protein n=1 Tax=Nonomuraea sp. NPDC050790 TaxID=3364371 RepID=UPI00378FA65E